MAKLKTPARPRLLLPRRKFLLGAGASLICAPAIIKPARANYFQGAVGSVGGGGGGSAYSSVDGSANAPDGSPQYATLLNAYVSSGGARRIYGAGPPSYGPASGGYQPPWYVAGVDYYVGVPSGTSLTDISVSQPAGTSFSAGSPGLLTVNQNNVTISGYDFSLYSSGKGVSLSCAYNNLTIENCKFDGSSYAAGIFTAVIYFTGQNLTIKNCKISGGSSTSGTVNESGIIIVNPSSDSGTITIQYNWMLNAVAGEFLNFGNAVDALNYNFNLLDNIQWQGAGHQNTLQWVGTGTAADVNVSFNTRVQTSNYQGEGFQFYGQDSGPTTFPSPECSYNTIYALFAGTNYFVAGNQGTGSTVTTGTPVSSYNYADLTYAGVDGMFSGFLSGSGNVAWTGTGNLDMSSGNSIAFA